MTHHLLVGLVPLQVLPVDLFHWVIASAPILLLLVLLIGFRWPADTAAAVAMFLAAAIAVTVFRTPLETLAVAAAKGAWDAIFVLYVVWAALLIYLVTDRAGAMYALQAQLQRYTNNDLFLVLAFGWVFVSFLQGVTGFGTPVAIVAPLLLALGVRPVYAVAIPLIGHAWNNNFGTLAVAWFGTRIVVDLQAPIETAVQTALLHTIPIIAAGFTIAWLYGRMNAIRHAWPMIVVVAAIQSIVLVVVVNYSQFISGFLAATVALVSLYFFVQIDRFKTQHEPFQRPAMTESMTPGGRAATDGGEPEPAEGDSDEPRANGSVMEERVDEEQGPKPVMGLGASLIPYAALTIVALTAAIPSVEEFLGQFEVGFSFPAVATGYLEHAAEDPYSPFAILSHPGTIILTGVVVGWLIYHSRGYYKEWRTIMEESPHVDEKPSMWQGLLQNGVPASLAIILLVIMANLMLDSGQIRVLALGLAVVFPPIVYLFASNAIGVLGAFITGSNTASNILFAPLQSETAAALGLSEPTVLGAQMTGGAFGNAISPSNVVLGTGTAGIVGREGDVLRITLPWVLLMILLVGAATVLLSGVTFLGGGV